MYMQDEHDEDLFEHYSMSELVLVDVRSGKTTPFGPARMYTG
jgi:hypothetical protein